MELLNLKFSSIEIIGFGLIAFVIFVAFKAMSKGIPLILKEHDKKKAFLRYFTVIEILVWVIYTIFVIQQLSDSNHILFYLNNPFISQF